MNNSSIGQAMRQVITDMREFGKADSSKLKEWATVRPDARRPDYITAIVARTWPRLAKQALAELKARRSDLELMKEWQTRINETGQRLASAAVLAEASFVPASQQRDWATLRGQFKQKMIDRGLTAAKAEEALTRLEAMDGSELQQGGTNVVGNSTSHLHGQAQKQSTALSGAVLALAVARFNQHVVTGTSPAASPAAVCADTEAQLEAAEKQIWTALRADDLLQASARGTFLAHLAASALMNDVLPQAAAMTLKRQSASARFKQDGQLALRLGDLIRDLLRAIALGHYVAWLAKWPISHEELRDWVAQAKKLSFPSKYRPPETKTISALAADAARFDGREVTIEGVLGAVKIVHRGRKVISSATVVDQNGKSVSIAIPYIKLDSGGMVPGSYARISGKWQKASKEVSGPALLVDRLNLGELGKASWCDWVTASVRHLFEPVPHGLAASWSWEAGADGAGNQLRYGTWFEMLGG